MHFGKMQERHFWKKIHNSVFSLWWRHIYRTANYVMITCDVITEATYRHHDISHVTSCERNITWWKLLMPKFWEIPRVSFMEKNSDLNNTILGTSQSVIPGKKIQNSQFPVIYDSFDFLQFLGISQTVISGKKMQRLFFFNFHLSLVLLNDDII